ncbi:MAG: DUF4912 domain-containing protein [Byssovorax sp.]
MRRQELEGLNREQLIAEAERLGVPRPRVLTQPELFDEIISRSTKNERERARARGWLGRARDLLARVVEKGLHLPDAARAIRSTGEERSWPAPPPPLPTVTLAEIYAAQGHLERAIGVLDEVLAREPDHQDARELRDRLIEQSRARTRGGRVAPAVVVEDEEAEPEQGAPAGEAGSGAESTMADENAKEEAAAPAAGESIVGAPTKEAAAEAEAIAEAAAVEQATEVEATAEPAAVEPVTGEPAVQAAPPVDEAAPPAEAAASPAGEAPAPEGELAPPALVDVDEIVAIAVDPRTVYLYWEVRATTLARAQARVPEGALVVRVASVTASWEGPVVRVRDLRVDALHGDRFIRDIEPGSNVRVSVGWASDGALEPFAVGIEVTAPHLAPIDEVAGEVGRWTPGGGVQPRHSGAYAGARPPGGAPPSFEGGAPAGRGEAPAPSPRVTPPDTSLHVVHHVPFPELWPTPAPSIAGGAPPQPPVVSWNEPTWVVQQALILREGMWFQPGGASELGRGGPFAWLGGASELGRGGASELGRL